MKPYIAIAISLLLASTAFAGCIGEIGAEASSINNACDCSCEGCDGSCEDCTGECKGDKNCNESCGDCKKECETVTPMTTILHESEVISEGTPNGAAATYDFTVPVCEKAILELDIDNRAVGCSAVGAGEFLILLKCGNEVIFREAYVGSATEAIELNAAGDDYTLVIECAGGGTGFLLSYDALAWCQAPVETACTECGD